MTIIKKKTIIISNNNSDIEFLSKHSKDVELIKIKNSLFENIKIFLELLKRKSEIAHLIIDDNINSQITALLFKLLSNCKYDIWIEKTGPKNILNDFVNQLAIRNSKSIITRSRQLKHYLQNYKKFTHVISKWSFVNNKFEKPQLEKPYTIFCYPSMKNFNLKLTENWVLTKYIEDSDVILLNFEDDLLKYELPTIIFKAIQTKKPIVIKYNSTKVINKMFRSVKNIFTTKEDVDLMFIEKLLLKNISFKMPKRYKFKYNLSLFKKIIK